MPRRSTYEGAVTVYKYGTPTGYDLPQVAVDQLRLANQLRNDLVEIEHDHEADRDAVWKRFPAIRDAEARLEEAVAAFEEAKVDARKQRMEDRTTRPREGTQERLAARRAALADAKQARREAKRRFESMAKEGLRAVAERRNQRHKALYAKYCQDGSLYWATFNDVMDHHNTSVARVISDRKAGRPAELRFHRFTGEGTLAVQPHRKAGQPARTPELLASGEGRWRNVVQLSPWVAPAQWDSMSRSEQRALTRVPAEQWARLTPEQRRDIGHGQLLFSIGSGAPLVRVPLVIHRMLPAGADVALVRITRRLVAGRPVVSVSITARVDKALPRTGGPAAALHIGWRSLGEAGCRVGVLASTGEIPEVPTELVNHVSLMDARTAEIRVPRGTLQIAGRPATVRSTRDQMLEDLRQVVIDAAATAPLPEGIKVVDVKRWRSPARFVRLFAEWPGAGAPGEVAEFIQTWQDQDRHLWRYEANEREQLSAHVDDLWRKVAAWVSSWAGLCLVDATDVRQLSRAPKVGDEDDYQARAARAARHLVAPGKLRSQLVSAATKRSVPVETVDISGMTGTHETCGVVAADHTEAREHVHLWCARCEAAYDQDTNVARWMLRSVGGGEIKRAS